MQKEYMCTYCGKKVTRGATFGRPSPGKCPNQMVDHIHGWLTEQNRLLIKGMQVVHTFLR